jgi:hypothetical protein
MAGGVDYIYLNQDTVQRWYLVNTVITFRFP